MEPQVDFLHTEIDTALILIRMAGVVHETELFTCAERIRNMASKVHSRAARCLGELPPHVLTASEREEIVNKIAQLKQALSMEVRPKAPTT